MNAKYGLLFLFAALAVLALPQVFALEFTSHLTVGQLNFYQTVENRTVYVHNEVAPAKDYVITIPPGWTAFTGTSCNTTLGTIVSCSLGGGVMGNFLLQNSIGQNLYNLTLLNASASSGTINNATLLRISPNEIFSTLVEFGRGRGNYPFSSDQGNNTKAQCNFLPNATEIELNFLHKVWNVKQYYNRPNEVMGNITYKCTYPNSSIIRNHLTTSLTRGETWNVSYFIPELEGSWERFGYIGMHIGPGEYIVGQNITINCTNMSMQFINTEVGGNFTVKQDTFRLQFRSREPFNITATSSTGEINNGTQEVEITYLINNTEIYPADTVQIEILAPQFSAFIGTRGELWGDARDRFLWELEEVPANSSVTITLVARFNTTLMPPTTSLNLSTGTKFKFIPCWEANAYNPTEYYQTVPARVIGTAAVDLSKNTTIVPIQQLLNNIFNLTVLINSTIQTISNTVTAINNTVTFINGTVTSINNTVNFINQTVSQINTTVQTINTTVNTINATVNTINNTVTIINTTVFQINQTVQSINTTVNNINSTVNFMNGTLNAVNTTVNFLNQTIISINGTITNISSVVNTITTIVNNISLTLGNISLAVNNTLLTANTEEILRLVRGVKDFDAELVFLVTDAFGLQQQAQQEANQGNAQAAITSLKEANDKLRLAADRLAKLQSDAAVQVPTVKEAADKTSGFLMTMLIIMACVLAYVYFTRDVRRSR